jgi:hypothetical protein
MVSTFPDERGISKNLATEIGDPGLMSTKAVPTAKTT